MIWPGTTPDLSRLNAAVERIPGRRVLQELPWLGGVGVGWWICWRDGGAMVLDGQVTGYQWADYMNNCWLVANRVTERYDAWRGIVHSGICGGLGESLQSYPNGAILLASLCVFVMVFAAGLAARALGGPWSGMLAAITLSWVPTVAQAAHWGNSTPLIAAGSALALAFGACLLRWPHPIWAVLSSSSACLAWATDKRGLLVIPGVLFIVLLASVSARRTEAGQGLVQSLTSLVGRLPEKFRSRLPDSGKFRKPLGWLEVHQRRLLLLPVFCLGLLVFPARDLWLGKSTNTEWERHMDAESMRQVHDGTARRWTQSARDTRTWTGWELQSPDLERFVPPFSSVIRRNQATHGTDQDLMNRCKDLPEDEFLVLPDFLWTDCARATLAHNTREKQAAITAMPLGLVWLSIPLCLLPARRGWRGVVAGLGLLAAVWSMWIAMASLNVMPRRYWIQFTTGFAILVPVGVGRLIRTVVPQSMSWGINGLACLGLCAWVSSVDINERTSEHTWAYNQGFLNRYHDVALQVSSLLGPDDDFLDCSDKGLNIWLLPQYTRFGTPMLKVDDAGRCMQWIGWEPEQGTRWIGIDPACKMRPQDAPQGGPQANNSDNHMSLEPVLESSAWEMVLDLYPEEARQHRPVRGGQTNTVACGEGRFQLWKLEK